MKQSQMNSCNSCRKQKPNERAEEHTTSRSWQHKPGTASTVVHGCVKWLLRTSFNPLLTFEIWPLASLHCVTNPYQSTWCPVFQACTAIPFFQSFFYITALCLYRRFCNVLPVLPTYTCSHWPQGTLQTTPSLFSMEEGSFTFTSSCLSLPLVLQTTLTLRGRQAYGSCLWCSGCTGSCLWCSGCTVGRAT